MNIKKLFAISTLCIFTLLTSVSNVSFFGKNFDSINQISSFCGVNETLASSVPNTPRNINKKISPVYVEFEGNDSIGSLLSTRLKEHFNTSNLFTLEGKDVPKFRILVSSISEFETRPSIGSAYSVIWLFSLSDATLRHYLAKDLGVITADGVNDLVARLVEKTDSLVTRYDYLFPKKD